MTLDRGNLRTLLLVSWSVFLLWLWVTGATARYLGPRTQWLIPFGGIALGIAAFAYSRAPASGDREPADAHPPAYGRDDWLAASGELVRRGRGLRLRATCIRRGGRPAAPLPLLRLVNLSCHRVST